MTDEIFYEELRATIRDAIASYLDTYTDEELRELATESLKPPARPTMADMTSEDRRACQWMQCDYAGITRDSQSRGVIGYFDHDEKQAVILTTKCGIVRRDYARVTPRPDLPRLEWPGTEKPADAPKAPTPKHVKKAPAKPAKKPTGSTPKAESADKQ